MSDKSSPSMTDSEKSKCHAIIHSAAVAAGGIGAGLAQLPMSDNLVIMPIQVGMVASLGNVFGKTLGESAIKSLISAAAGTVIGRSVSQTLLGWIPVVGNVINASTAFTITEAIGWTIANDFAIERRKAEEESRRLEAERRRLEEEAEAMTFAKAISSSQEEYRENMSRLITARVKSIGCKIAAIVKSFWRFLCSLPEAVLRALGDMLGSVKAFVLLLIGLVVKPFRTIPLLFVKLWGLIKSFGVVAWKAIQICAPFLMCMKIALYGLDKLNILPNLHAVLTTIIEVIDLVN